MSKPNLKISKIAVIFMVQKLERTRRFYADALGLELVEYFTRGELHVRGYAGNDKADHCAQLGVLRDVYAALGRRWGSRATPH